MSQFIRGATYSNPIWHGRWRIWQGITTPPGQPWAYQHTDFDGAEDGNGQRHGHAASVDAAKAAIEEWVADNPAKPVEDLRATLKRAIAASGYGAAALWAAAHGAKLLDERDRLEAMATTAAALVKAMEHEVSKAPVFQAWEALRLSLVWSGQIAPLPTDKIDGESEADHIERLLDLARAR